MSEIATSERQITVYYNSSTPRGKQTLAYAETAGIPVFSIDILKTPITSTQIAEFANRLEIDIKGLVNLEHSFYKSRYANQEFSDEDWLKMLHQNPEIMKQPIALHGDKIMLIETPTDILNL